MAKIKVFEGRVRIESTVLTDDAIRKAQALEPDALILSDKKDNATFGVSRSETTSNVNAYGVVFQDGKALTDVTLDKDGMISIDDEYALKAILVKINKIENQVSKIKADKDLDIEFLD